MKLFGKTSLGLVILAAAGLTTSAHAGTYSGTNLSVTEADSFAAGLYTYTYGITPTLSTTQIAFTFDDPTVLYVAGSATGPLNVVLPTSVGSFIQFGGGTLAGGAKETIQFTSPDGPGGLLGVGSSGPNGGSGSVQKVLGPSPVPEASTTVSLGLLLILGMGGVVLTARKNKAKASA